MRSLINKKMNVKCEQCFLKTYTSLLNKFNVPLKAKKIFLSYYKQIIIENNDLSNPEIQKILTDKFNTLLEITNPFAEEKKYCNQLALLLYNEWKPKIINSNNHFDLALRLALAGNIMDYSANDKFDIHQTIDNVLSARFAINDSELLKNKINTAKTILYLGDNAGEIVFDKLFIEIMNHDNVYYGIKGAPILNDVTIDDAIETHINLVAKVISNGCNYPSTILKRCSKEFVEIYESADLIISKGQGNFEGLMHENDSRIFYLMMVKCDVIAELINVKKGSFVVFNKYKFCN